MLAFTFDYRRWRDYSFALYPIIVLLLVILLFVGTTLSGTRGWFSFFGFTLQPVELAKIVLIMFLAWYFNRCGEDVKRLRHFLISGAAAAGLSGLVLLQPDFGSAMVLFIIWFIRFVKRLFGMLIVELSFEFTKEFILLFQGQWVLLLPLTLMM